MYELNSLQINQVSGGELIYVTEYWKHDMAMQDAKIFGGFCGGLIGCLAALAGDPVLFAAAIGTGLIISALFYGLTLLEYSDLQNDNWYIFS